MTEQFPETTSETQPDVTLTPNTAMTQKVGIAIGAVVLVVCGFFVGYAVHGNSASSTPSGGFPGGGQFPGGANGQAPGGGQVPGGANGQAPGGGQFPGGAGGQLPGGGQLPSAPPTGGAGPAVSP